MRPCHEVEVKRVSELGEDGVCAHDDFRLQDERVGIVFLRVNCEPIAAFCPAPRADVVDFGGAFVDGRAGFMEVVCFGIDDVA